jgi:hypothetical protein
MTQAKSNENRNMENVALEQENQTVVEDGVPQPPAEKEAKEAAAVEPAAVDPAPEKKESFMEAATSKALRPFVIISSSYLLFTITDGAIRMIVLLHAYTKKFSAFEVAIMFTLYELAGVFTNLVSALFQQTNERIKEFPTCVLTQSKFIFLSRRQAAGFMGARWGIKFTLVSGLTLQLFSYGLLFGWQDDWTKEQAIIYVTISQMFAGIAKDLTKLGGKTVTKLVTPEEQETKLFKLVSFITGWKNSLKGVGYFLGSALIQVSYELALGVMMGLVLLAMPWAILGLDRSLGMAKQKNAAWNEVFDLNNPNLNWLSLARLFLFASRDFWFEVPLPFFLRSPACDGLGIDECMIDGDCDRGAVCGLEGICQNVNIGGGCGGLGVERVVVGALLGGYIILYGQVQSWTPQLVIGPLKQTPPNKLTEIIWGLVNCLPTFVMWIVMSWSPTFQDNDQEGMTVWIIVTIVTFAVIFAINSSIHSFLVVNYASKEKIAVSVGFYYMSNAVGRLLGTLGSGILYTYVGDDLGESAGTDAVAGLAACFLAGTLSSLLAALITIKIDDNKAGLKCGSCLTLVAAEVEEKAPVTDPLDKTEEHREENTPEPKEAENLVDGTMVG